jgi:subtilisin family serine protease
MFAAALMVMGAAVAGAVPAAPGAAAPAQDAAAAAASRQLLVMVRLPPEHFRPDSAYGATYGGDSGRAARRRIAEELAQAHGLKLVDAWPMPVIGVDCFVMERGPDLPAQPVLEALAHDPRVAWAQPVALFHGLDGTDPLYPVQPAARAWHLAQLHRASTGRGVRVAVVDSGIDGANPDLAGQVALRANFVDATPDAAEAHGTAVAGIIAARAGNGAGIEGVAPGARLLALRACWQAPGEGARCSSFTLAKAINFALLHDARIINLSLSGPDDRLLQALLDAAAVRGTAVVGAADPHIPNGGFPASHPGVIVAAAEAGPEPATAGTEPPARALRAPGADIPTCAPGARWAFVSGASYAAAHVTGLVALLAQLESGASPARLKAAIVTRNGGAMALRTADPPGHAPQAGSIDACATIARAAGACTCSCSSTAAMQASRNR